MSKAFTKEDTEQDSDELEQTASPLPKGSPNYITPTGLRALEKELDELTRIERPKVVETVTWAASLGDRSENADYIYGKKRLKEIDRRIRFLSKKLDNVELVDPEKRAPVDQVFFGATVHVQDEEGQLRTYCIVGVDETDASRGKVSWISPIGRALLKAKVGDTVTVKTPGGEIDLEVLTVEYRAIE
ncbi:MAG: transcription elongation factor GreB [Bdellovibrionales bacterium]|nr:transcription elongation factor GreB [Bdellovibrionales bacterium]